MHTRFAKTLACLTLTLFAHDPASAARGNRATLLERRLEGPDGSVMIVAHRGCWKGTSENSLDAIESCVAFGIDMVELDVRRTRDGVLVLMHDATVDRMTDGTGQVENLDWTYLQTLRLREGAGRGSPLTDRRIPTFADALAAAKGRILINVDAKTDLNDAILPFIDKYGDRRQVLFKQYDPADRLHATSPWLKAVRFQPIIDEDQLSPAGKRLLDSFSGFTPVGYEIDIAHPEAIAGFAPLIRERCARFWVNSLNGTEALHDRDALREPSAVWGRMIDDGVDTIQTDDPLALKAFVAHREPKTYFCSKRSR